MADHSMTMQILRDIRGEVSGLRQDTMTRLDKIDGRLDLISGRLDQTNMRADETNGRLDRVCEGQIRMATEMTTLRMRFEHFVVSEGDPVRDLKARVHRLEGHTGLLGETP